MNMQMDEAKPNGRLAVRSKDVSFGKTLAELAKDFKRTFADEEQAIEEAKYSYQTKRIDILHQVLVIKDGDRKATKHWAVKNGPVGDKQVAKLLQLETQMYPELEGIESRTLKSKLLAQGEKVRKSIATKGLEPTLYPRISSAEQKAVERELEAQRKAAESPQGLVFDLATRRQTAIELLNVGHKVMSKEHHPDVGGSNDRQRILNDAKAWAKEIIERSL